LGLSTLLFCLALITMLTRRNAIAVLMSVELLLNAGALNFTAFSRAYNLLEGQTMTLFVIILAAAEAVVALALVMAIYKEKGHIELDKLEALKG